jgi:hypothetical protein
LSGIVLPNGTTISGECLVWVEVRVGAVLRLVMERATETVRNGWIDVWMDEWVDGRDVGRQRALTSKQILLA